MSTQMPWFRMYVDFLNDPKLISLAFEDQRHFVGVLALKSDGALDNACDPDLLDRIVAQRLWIDHAIIREVKKRLVAAGLIDTSWQPAAWDRRQFKSDSSKERVARYRAKKKGADSFGNGDETLQQRPSNAVDTDADTEADADKEVVKELEAVGRGHAATDASPAATPTSMPSRAKTATRLPDDWILPKAWGEWALQERPDMAANEVRKEAEVFADYWRAKAGADARKADWQATWRNWVRRCDGRKASARGASMSQQHTGETAYQRSMRERAQAIVPSIARQAPNAPAVDFFKSQAIEVQARCIEQPQKQIGGRA